MACSLSHSVTAREDFVGVAGRLVTLKLVGPPDVGVAIIRIQYGAQVDAVSPFQFTLQTGTIQLVLLYGATQPGVELRMVEVCNGTEQVLDRFIFDPRQPARGYFITA